MNTAQLLLIVIINIVTIGAIVILFKKTNKPQPQDNSAVILLQNQVQELARQLEQRAMESSRQANETQNNIHQTIQHQFGQSAKIITEVTEKLVKIDETNKQIRTFAEQLQNLEDILQNSKQRGILGEYYLENVLKNVLPPGNFQMQYKFTNGDIVDAVVFVKDKVIPIDSKFSLENYNKIVSEKDPKIRMEYEKSFKNDLKTRIDETSKYIKPNEGTMDFAFMFIPAEGIYYDLLVNKIGAITINTYDLIEYAFREKHVIIVSPTSFLAYLQTVMQGLRALQIDESAKEIRKRVEDLGRHLAAYEEYINKLGKNLETTVNSYNLTYKEFNKIDKDVMRITGEERTNNLLQLDKPRSGE